MNRSFEPRPEVRFTPEQLDRLRGWLAPGRAPIPTGPSMRFDDTAAATGDRDVRYLRAVDRAIAEMAGRRGRRRGA